MKINSITNNSIITPKTSGYIAATSIGLATISGFCKNKNMKKIHKPAAILGTLFTLIHIGIIKSYSQKRHRM